MHKCYGLKKGEWNGDIDQGKRKAMQERLHLMSHMWQMEKRAVEEHQDSNVGLQLIWRDSRDEGMSEEVLRHQTLWHNCIDKTV